MTGGPLAGPASAYPTFRRPASICFSEPNDVFVPGLIGLILAGLRVRGSDHAELGGSNGQDRGAQKTAATMVDFFGHLFLPRT